MLVLPKMINDPETKKEIENMQFPKVGLIFKLILLETNAFFVAIIDDKRHARDK